MRKTDNRSISKDRQCILFRTLKMLAASTIPCHFSKIIPFLFLLYSTLLTSPISSPLSLFFPLLFLSVHVSTSVSLPHFSFTSFLFFNPHHITFLLILIIRSFPFSTLLHFLTPSHPLFSSRPATSPLPHFFPPGIPASTHLIPSLHLFFITPSVLLSLASSSSTSAEQYRTRSRVLQSARVCRARQRCFVCRLHCIAGED